jgi:arylsulfatase
MYGRWGADQLWLFVPMQQVVGQWLGTFRQFPPRQPTASFTIDKILQQMQQSLHRRPPR